jgi:hypothetical protein
MQASTPILELALAVPCRDDEMVDLSRSVLQLIARLKRLRNWYRQPPHPTFWTFFNLPYGLVSAPSDKIDESRGPATLQIAADQTACVRAVGD